MNPDPASLDNLHDIVQSVPMSLWWPLAPGWWVVIGVAGIIALTGLIRYLLKRQRNLYRRWALQELDALDQLHAQPQMLPTLLKRVAMVAYSRAEVGALAGKSWLDFLNREVPESFDAECAKLLLQLDYRRDADLSAAELTRLQNAIRHWTLSHPDQRGRK